MLHLAPFRLVMPAKQALFFSLPCPQTKACHVRTRKNNNNQRAIADGHLAHPSLSPCFKLHGTETRAYKGSFAHALIEVRSSSKLRRCCFKPFFVGLIVSGGLDSHFFPCVCLSTARPLVCKTILQYLLLSVPRAGSRGCKQREEAKCKCRCER